MQTLTQIRQLLADSGLQPQKRFGQCFMIDQNLLAKLLELADIAPADTILEVGPGTGTLTEELLKRAGKVVAVEIDRGLAGALTQHFASQPNFTLLCQDALEGKHQIAPAVVQQLLPAACLVSNLPYNIATPLIAQCLVDSWRQSRCVDTQNPWCRFDRLTFTVQREVADRLAARPGHEEYGQVSVLVALLGKLTLGPVLPPSAFWPPPTVDSRIVRIDFDPARAAQLADEPTLQEVLTAAFGQRRKQIGSAAKRSRFAPAEFAAALAQADIDPAARAETIQPEQFLTLANALSPKLKSE